MHAGREISRMVLRDTSARTSGSSTTAEIPSGLAPPQLADRARAEARNRATFDFHGLRVELRAISARVIGEARLLYDAFLAADTRPPDVVFYSMAEDTHLPSSMMAGWGPGDTLYEQGGSVRHWAHGHAPIPPFLLPEMSRKFLALHAGVVAHGRDAMIISGSPQRGKTVLTLALVGAGLRFLSDELAVIERGGWGVLPHPRAVLLRQASLRLLPELRDTLLRAPARLDDGHEERLAFHVPRAFPDRVGGPCRIRFVVLLRPRESGRTDLAPVRKSVALLQLMIQTVFSENIPFDERVAAVSTVVERADCYTLRADGVEQAVQRLKDLYLQVPERDGASPPALS